MKQSSKLPILAILLVTLGCALFFLIAAAFFSYQNMTSQAMAPYVSIVNNNLGAKTKLLHIKSSLQDFLVETVCCQFAENSNPYTHHACEH